MASASKPYKFQAFVTMSPPEEDGRAGLRAVASATLPPGQIRRMAVRGEHHGTHSSHFFSALGHDIADGVVTRRVFA